MRISVHFFNLQLISGHFFNLLIYFHSGHFFNLLIYFPTSWCTLLFSVYNKPIKLWIKKSSEFQRFHRATSGDLNLWQMHLKIMCVI